MGADEEGTHAALSAVRSEVTKPNIAANRGRVVKTTGDGLLAEFASVVDAVRCAVELQRAMALRNDGVPKERRIEFRIGINLGDIIIDEHDIYGDGVNVAARLEALAEPGGICVSRVVRDQVRDKVEFGFEDRGEQQVKNITRPVRVYRIPLAETARTKGPVTIARQAFARGIAVPEHDGRPRSRTISSTALSRRLRRRSRVCRGFSSLRAIRAFTYKGRAVDVKQVARELGVRYVLEGSVHKAGNRVRITGQLIDTATGAHIWADRFDGALDDIFELQDQVAGSVVGAIEPKLRQSEIDRAIRKPTASLDAYDLYLRGLAEFHKFTEAGMAQAAVLLQGVLEIDPLYASAAAMLAHCRGNQLAYGWCRVSDTQIREAARLAEQAIAMGRDDPDALSMAAWAVSYFSGAHGTAASALDRALMLNPSSAHAWMASGYVLYLRNWPEAAIEAFHRAFRLSPLDPLNYQFAGGIAFAHLSAGRYAEAAEWADRSLNERLQWLPGLRVKVVALAHLDRIAEARELLHQVLVFQPDLRIAGLNAYPGMTVTPEIFSMWTEGFRKAGLPEE